MHVMPRGPDRSPRPMGLGDAMETMPTGVYAMGAWVPFLYGGSGGGGNTGPVTTATVTPVTNPQPSLSAQSATTTTPPHSSTGPHPTTATSAATAAMARQLGIDQESLLQFQSEVHLWVELDRTIRRLQEALKERRTAKALLQDRIMRFMARSDVNDVSVDSGNVRLRYRVSYVRTPLSQQAIRDRITQYFASNPGMAQTLNATVFARERTERHTLCKLGGAPPAQLPARGV